jgi:MoxR-like ATPase
MTQLNPDNTKTLESLLAKFTADAVADPEAFAIYQNSSPAMVTWQPAYQQGPAVIASSPAVQVARETSTEPVASDSFMQFTMPQLSDPDVSVYIPRTDVYGKSEVEVFDFARATQEVVAIDGHAGTGKTSSARHYSALRGLPFLRLEMTQSIDTSVTQGKFVPDGVGGLKWVYSPLARLIQEPSVILLNEFTRTSPKNATLFTGLLEERQLLIDSHLGEVIPVHPETLFVVDYNSGYRGTQGIDQAIFDRFNIKLKFQWSEEAEAKRIPSPALREFAKALRVGAELEDKYSTPVSTRLLLNFVKQSQGLSLPFAVEVFLNAFPVEEQDAIKMLFQVYSANIASELGCSTDGLNI